MAIEKYLTQTLNDFLKASYLAVNYVFRSSSSLSDIFLTIAHLLCSQGNASVDYLNLQTQLLFSISQHPLSSLLKKLLPIALESNGSLQTHSIVVYKVLDLAKY